MHDLFWVGFWCGVVAFHAAYFVAFSFFCMCQYRRWSKLVNQSDDMMLDMINDAAADAVQSRSKANPGAEK